MSLEVSPEPEPEFAIGRSTWGAAWPAHIYTFSILFLVMTLYNLNSILGLLFGTDKAMRNRTLFIITNTMLLVFNFITSLHLFVDPYESKEHFKIQLPGLFFILFGLRIPCLTASFSYIHISLLEAIKVKVYSKKLQDIRFLVVIITSHFVVVSAIHVYLTFYPDKFQLLVICQIFFVIYGISMSVSFSYAYIKIRTHVTRTHISVVVRKNEMKDSNDNTDQVLQDKTISSRPSFLRPRSPFYDKCLHKLLKVFIIVTVSTILCCVSMIYSTISMLVKSSFQLQPWPWLIFQTVSRIGELGMVFSMSYLVRRSIFETCVTKVFR